MNANPEGSAPDPRSGVCGALPPGRGLQLVVFARRVSGSDGGALSRTPPMLMAAASALTRFTPSGRSGPHPSKPRRVCLLGARVPAIWAGASQRSGFGLSHRTGPRPPRSLASLLTSSSAPGRRCSHEVQHVVGTRLIIPVVADQGDTSRFDFLLRRLSTTFETIE